MQKVKILRLVRNLGDFLFYIGDGCKRVQKYGKRGKTYGKLGKTNGRRVETNGKRLHSSPYIVSVDNATSNCYSYILDLILPQLVICFEPHLT